MKLPFSYADCYLRYIQSSCSTLNSDFLGQLKESLEATNWENPEVAIDWNNLAVVTLVEAEQCSDSTMRGLYVETALEYLNNGVQLGHPLCAAHLALVLALTGQSEQATQVGFSNFICSLQFAHSFNQEITPGLVYLPLALNTSKSSSYNQLTKVLEVRNGYTQALTLLSEALCRSQLVFYSLMGLRFLHLATQLTPDSVFTNLKLGISSFINNQWEGLLYLQRASRLAPSYAPVLQALYLAYRNLEQIETADFWLNTARSYSQQNPHSLDWQWTELSTESSLTYLPFESTLLITVEPSFRSIVTSVLLAEGDWFEKEMEFWRNHIEAGMTVIDVGANVGVYTFSAAQRVGPSGRVLAVEPFSRCIRCLEETCRVNQLSWVKVCAGAASDRNGTAKLSLKSASELNQVISDDTVSDSFEEITCFTLDSLCDRENLNRVDFLKIDAEGHEVSVLAGSERILTQFSPTILYENIAGSQGSNLPVADFLRARGYQLFRYQPYVQQLSQINSTEDLQGILNVIALPQSKVSLLNL